MSLPEGLYFDLVRADEVPAAYNLEVEGFPPDEAATLEKLQYRQQHASNLFLGAYLPSRELIASCTSTASSSPTLTHDSMSTHEPGGRTVCLHSVVVSPVYRRHGVASALLRAYIERLTHASPGRYAEVRLLAHEELVKLYERIGFENVGRSDIQHGERPWWELRHAIEQPPDQAAAAQTFDQSALLTALQQQLASKNAPADVKTVDELGGPPAAEGPGVKKLNKSKARCPRPGCNSLLFLRNAAELLALSTSHPLANTPSDPLLPAPQPDYAWRLPGPMSFENITFSKVAPGAPEGVSKFLGCGECELGPLGWVDGRGCWIDVRRAVYDGR